jgi:uridine kinase
VRDFTPPYVSVQVGKRRLSEKYPTCRTPPRTVAASGVAGVSHKSGRATGWHTRLELGIVDLPSQGRRGRICSMVNTQEAPSKPCVIVVSGSVGSGKSTVVARLSELLGNCPTLIFDHYEQYVEWPQDMSRWIEEGADPSQIRVPRLKEDLLSLLEGVPITYPVDGEVVHPAEYVIVEEPSGQERWEIAAYIDLVVFIDVPQDVCVARMVQRTMDMEVWDSERTFENQSKKDLVRQMNAVASWVTHYLRARSMYVGVSSAVKRKADIVVDGMRPVDEIVAEIVSAIG